MEPPADPPLASDPPASPARRPWTFLGRLAEAVREQNWFAVALEIVIVVLGVVIGFQVTNWGQDRSDRAKEQVYLHQLAEDLRETERRLAEVDSVWAGYAYATGRLYRAFYTPERPPRDSLLAWIDQSEYIRGVRPVLGTVEALVATGDLGLLRDDSLQAAVTSYLDATRELMTLHEQMIEGVSTAGVSVAIAAPNVLPDRVEMMETYDPAIRDSLLGSSVLWSVPVEDRRRPFPFDPEAFLTSREAYLGVVLRASVTDSLMRIREHLRHQAAMLREQVEAELDR